MLTHILRRREECAGETYIATGEAHYILGLLHQYCADPKLAGDIEGLCIHGKEVNAVDSTRPVGGVVLTVAAPTCPLMEDQIDGAVDVLNRLSVVGVGFGCKANLNALQPAAMVDVSLEIHSPSSAAIGRYAFALKRALLPKGQRAWPVPWTTTTTGVGASVYCSSWSEMATTGCRRALGFEQGWVSSVKKPRRHSLPDSSLVPPQ